MTTLPENFTGATLDSRLVKPGMLFVAIKGEHVDGHDFIDAALAKGAAGIVDGREELARLAHEYRKSLNAKVIGITGSAGKTTTKEMTATCLRAGGYKVHATEGNFNNDLGLPITILNCPKDAEYLVLEMGTNHPGEIAYLCDIAEPDIGIITSIGTAHIEFFKTQDGIADEKGVLFERLTGSKGHYSFAVLARSNERYDRLAAKCKVDLLSVDDLGDEDYGEDEDYDGDDRCPFDDKHKMSKCKTNIEKVLRDRLPGLHNVTNAMLAVYCAMRCDMNLGECIDALVTLKLPGSRWRIVEKDGVTFIDDTYNANPTSMLAALGAFASIDVKGRRIVVLGDMFELGEQSAELHAKVRARAEEYWFDGFFYVGEAMGGATREETKAALAEYLKPGDTVLLKASHGMHLDELLK